MSKNIDEVNQLRQALFHVQDTTPEHMARFFKMGPGEYAEHDRFIGITTPTLRAFAEQHGPLDLPTLHHLLQSPYNEERLLALLCLVDHYQNQPFERGTICQFYVDHSHCVNNWNLVDASAHHILGQHLRHRDRQILSDLAASPLLWERRIAIVSTWAMIKAQDYTTTLKLSLRLLQDPEDLMHKGVGWMLREVGKQHEPTLKGFLDQHATVMPRTMLRYAIERLAPDERQHYMQLRPNTHNH